MSLISRRSGRHATASWLRRFISFTLLTLAIGGILVYGFWPDAQWTQQFEWLRGSSQTSSKATPSESAIEAYILAHPEVILRSIESYYAKEAAKQKNEADQAITAYRDQWSQFPQLGNGSAGMDRTIVMFFDYHCGYCREEYTQLVSLLKRRPDLRLVMVPYPIISPLSKLEAEVVLYAWHHHRDRFANLNDTLMKADVRSMRSEEALHQLLNQHGYGDCLNPSEEAKQKIQASIEEVYAMGKKLMIQGLPTLLVGEKMISGYQSLDQLEGLLPNDQ
jgi:protein-disulfide isomerase